MFPCNKQRKEKQFQSSFNHPKIRESRNDERVSYRRADRQINIPLPIHIKYAPQYVTKLESSSSTARLRGLTAIRKLLLSTDGMPPNGIANANCISLISECMYSDCGDTVSEAVFIIKIIAAKYPTIASISGVLDGLKHILSSNTSFPDNSFIINECVCALLNICRDQKQYQQIIISNGICMDIINLVMNFDIEDTFDLYLNTSLLIHEILHGSTKTLEVPTFTNKLSNVLNFIDKIFVESNDNVLVSNGIWCLYYLSKNKEYSLRQCIIEFKQQILIKSCINTLRNEIDKHSNKQTKPENATGNSYNEICKPCVKFIGNIVRGDCVAKECVLNSDYLQSTEILLNNDNVTTRRDAMWSLSNIFAGNPQQIESILQNNNTMKTIIRHALYDQVKVRIEAVICISNALIEATPIRTNEMADNGAIKAMCSLLNPSNIIKEIYIVTIVDALELFLLPKNINMFSKPYNMSRFASIIEENKGFAYLEERLSGDNLSNNTEETIINLLNNYAENKCDNFSHEL